MSDEQNTLEEYPVGSFYYMGSWNGEPIQWVVIRAEEAYRLLLCTGYVTERRMGKSSTNRWENSELYHWLHTEFLHEAFTEKERQRLCKKDGSYVTLLSREELIEYGSLPACANSYQHRWWLRDIDAFADGDNVVDYLCLSFFAGNLDWLPPTKSLFVRPTIIVSLDGKGQNVPSHLFNNHYFCPFCGTERRYRFTSCHCCGISGERHRWTKIAAINEESSKKLNGCLVSILLFCACSIFLGCCSISVGVPAGFLFLLFGVAPLILLFSSWIKARTEPREEEQYKYTNETDPPHPVRISYGYQERCADIYHNARILQNNATNFSDYHHASNMYALIPGYKDADEQKEACLKALKAKAGAKLLKQ